MSAQSAAPVPTDVTRIVARFATSGAAHPDYVRREAVRSFLNWIACAIGGSRHETVETVLAALGPFAGPPQASVLGRGERVDVMTAALANGISSHVFDFDDIHLRTLIHPAGPVASALLALSEFVPLAGSDFVDALIVGMEVECRLGAAVNPSHYAAGWHITSTCGVLGAAVAAGAVLRLDEARMIAAIGLAASQPVGLKIMFGTMAKSFHPGRAAQNGLTAALLASKGYVAAARSLEGVGGWGGAVSDAPDWSEVTDALGSRYEAARNTYKPYACGMLTHPSIEAVIQLRNAQDLRPEHIASVELHVHPLVLQLTGNKWPETGLAAKFSVYHCVAAALIHGAASERQFSDVVVRDPQVVDLRGRVNTIVEETMREAQARVIVQLRDGRTCEAAIAQVIGSEERPMSDHDLDAKLLDLADGILPDGQARRVIDLCWRLETLTDAGEVGRAASLSS